MLYHQSCYLQLIRKYYALILWSIPFISFLLHWHVFNLDLVGIHVWRQTQTQNVINNFYREDMNIFHPKINAYPDTTRVLRLEFPVMQWLFACVHKIFGPHIGISRILTFLIGLGSVYGMYHLCNSAFRDKAVAAICSWCFSCSPLFYYYTVNPLPDNMALCCGIWSIALFYSYIHTRHMKYIVWSAVFLSLATLTKLPFVLYGSFMLYYLSIGKINKLSVKTRVLICITYMVFIAPAITWYATVMPCWKPNAVLTGLFTPGIKISTLPPILWGNLVSVLPELIINYAAVLFFITGCYLVCKQDWKNWPFTPVFAAWGITLILYFIFELHTIALVHDYYLMPFLPPVFLLVAYGARKLLLSANRHITSITLLCLAILPLTAFLRADSRWDIQDPGFPAAFYKHKKELRNLTPPNAICIAGNDISDQILLYYIDRKGWTYNNDALDDSLISLYISKGATYLFLSGEADSKPCVKAHLAEKIFDKESLRVYKLK